MITVTVNMKDIKTVDEFIAELRVVDGRIIIKEINNTLSIKVPVQHALSVVYAIQEFWKGEPK